MPAGLDALHGAPPGDADVFQDARSVALLQHLRRVGPSEACALLRGESGTGKEMIARALHGWSARAAKAFVGVNCGAFPTGQLEAELFGHQRGAIPGAFAARAGWIESAHGGTMFLDEVDRLPLHLQARLLGVLQERQVLRIGSRQHQPADVRLIAATVIDLEQAVLEGRFRDDLFHTLRAAQVDVPPLRERPGDILPLARHFVTLACGRLGYAPARFTPAAQARLLQHAWPGNLRELENVVHRALLLAGGGRDIGPDLLSLSALPAGPGRVPADGTAAAPASEGERLLQEALRQLCTEAPEGLFELVERATVQAAWQQSHLNQIRAAQLLGISRNVLRARLIAHGAINARR